MDNNFNSGNWAWLFALGAFIAIIAFVIIIAFLIFYFAGKWKLYEKAGREGWKAIIPFYNDWVYVEIAGLNSWYFLLLIASTISLAVDIDEHLKVYNGAFKIIALIGLFFCNYNISKKIHKDTLFAVLMTLFPFIVIPIVGFSKNIEFDDTVVVSANGPIDEVNNSSSKARDNDNVKDLEEEKKEIEKRIKELKEEEKNKEEDAKKDAKDTDKKDEKKYKYCTNCGAKIDKTSKFCGSCGKEI